MLIDIEFFHLAIDVDEPRVAKDGGVQSGCNFGWIDQTIYSADVEGM
jgi:hypothetical protein